MSVLDGPLVFVDVETTGLSFTRSRIIEVAAVRVERSQVVSTFNSLVDPQGELPEFISNLTGISNDDLLAAPSFFDIQQELYEIMKDAVFVAHNVRFDYGFLKHEFKRAGRQFSPKQLCTVRLSKTLYPDVRGHKLQDIIDRCGIEVTARHRAYDDAQAMWQFVQHVRSAFPSPSVDAAVMQQVKSPSLPKNIDPDIVINLPDGPGVYIFNDESGRPLYVGKSINLKKRVTSHFSSDLEHESEFKISQQVADIQVVETHGELEALLLESSLVKDLQPLFNRQLRRRRKMTLAKQSIHPDGYIMVKTEDTSHIEPGSLSQILAVYTTRSQARQFIDQLIKDFELCPLLMGAEKGKGSCFSYQLKKCRGACLGKECAADYNRRLLLAFEGRRLQKWPYASPVIIEEKTEKDSHRSMIVDQWCVVADVIAEPDCEPVVKFQDKMFDIDTYKILRSYLASKPHLLSIRPLGLEELQVLSAA